MQKGPPLVWKFIQPTVGLFLKMLEKRSFFMILSKIKDGYPDTRCIRITVLKWCARRDLNPYAISTRTSNVPVCQFQHSRKRDFYKT